MTTAVSVQSHILGSPGKSLVTRRELLHYGTQYAIDSAIRSLKRKGDIIPVCSGVYLRVGRVLVLPTAAEIAAVRIAAFNRKRVDSGREVAAQHGLSRPDTF